MMNRIRRISSAGRWWTIVAVGALIICGPIGASANTVFDITYESEVPAGVQTAFNQATARWSELLNDSATVKITVDWEALGPTTLGQASVWMAYGNFDIVRNLVAGGGEAGDAREEALLPNLPTAAEFSVDLPSGFAFDNTAFISTANYKALGGSYTGTDGEITFSSDFSWDFDPSDGITAGSYDFQGVAVHEIGHTLGFLSRVDHVDITLHNGQTDSNVWISALDLFRFDTDDLDEDFDFTDTARNLTPGGSHSFYYGDGSVPMATGVYNGDGRQGSHWKDSLLLGIMDPTAAAGELLTISQNDLIALDLIGWDVVPEPSTLVLVALGMLCLLGYAWWRRRLATGRCFSSARRRAT